jgi:hypothetical protein
MLVTVVQGLVRAFDEDLAPLKETGRSKPGKRAEDDLLDERGLHSSFKQHEKCQKTAAARSGFTKIPIAACA